MFIKEQDNSYIIYIYIFTNITLIYNVLLSGNKIFFYTS